MANFLRFNGTTHSIELQREIILPDWKAHYEIALPTITQDVEYHISGDPNNGTHSISYTLTSTEEVIHFVLGSNDRVFTYPISGSPHVSAGTKFDLVFICDDSGAGEFTCLLDGNTPASVIASSSFIRHRDFAVLGRLGPAYGSGTFCEMDFHRFRLWSDVTETTLVRDYNADSTSSNGAGVLLYDDVSNTGYGKELIGEFPTWQSDGPVNANPVADAGPDQFGIAGGATVTLDGSGSSDSDGTIASYLWESLGLQVAITNADSAVATFVAPQQNSDFTMTFRLTVTDNDGGFTTDTVDINILEFDFAPTANAGPDQSVATGATVQLDGSGLDPNLETVTYSWVLGTVPATSTASLSNASIANPTFVADLDGTYIATLTTNDGGQDSIPDSVTITASSGNQAPVADAGPNQNDIVGGAQVTLDGTGSSDSDGVVTSYTWSQIDGQSVVLSDTESPQPTFTAPDESSQIVLTFQLIVEDNDGAVSAPDTVTINVFPQEVLSTINLAIDNVPNGTHPTTLVNKGTNTYQVLNMPWTGFPNSVASTTLADVAVGTLFDYYVADINNDGGAGLVINQATV